MPGTEACPCYGNRTCNAGLSCASNLCVVIGGTGGAGGGATGGSGGSSAGGSAGAPQCSPDGAVCSQDPTACCIGLTCVVDARSPSNGACAKLCRGAIDCTTGCCSLLTDGSASVCAPPQYCTSACRQVGSSCLDDVTACCPGTTCAYDDPSSTTASCAALCDAPSDCVSGCCAPAGPVFVCSDPLYCSGGCLPAGTRPCGLGTACCPGSYCISDSINQICLPMCTLDSDCASGCCAVPNGNGIHVCTEPAFCGR